MLPPVKYFCSKKRKISACVIYVCGRELDIVELKLKSTGVIPFNLCLFFMKQKNYCDPHFREEERKLNE